MLACVIVGGWIRDGSITFTHSADPLVTNGIAYDRAEIDLSGLARVVVPKTAIVSRSADAHHCRLVVEKTQDFVGHPAERASIVETRQEIGCATQTNGNTIAIGTFGESDTHIEGGNYVHLRISVPEGVEVVRRDDLEGPDSVSNKALNPDRFSKQELDAAPSGAPWRVPPVVPMARAEREQIEKEKAAANPPD
jgi:hypothetical protein